MPNFIVSSTAKDLFTKTLEPCSPGYWLRFNAISKVGSPFPDTYKVMWRVTNTDVAAKNASALQEKPPQNSHDPWVSMGTTLISWRPYGRGFSHSAI